MSATKKFLENIKKHQETKKTKRFNGFLEDYLKLIEKDKTICVLAHKRLYKQIMSHGITTIDETNERCNKLFGGETIKIYNY